MSGDWDKEVMGRTVKMRFTGNRRIFTRGQVIREISFLVNIKNIEAVYKVSENSEWFVIFKTSLEADTLGNGAEKALKDGLAVRIDRIDRRKAYLHVHWFPMHMKQDLVEEFFERIGSNIVCNYEEMDIEGMKIKTGVIHVMMTVSPQEFEEIPYRAVISGRNVLITMWGRPPQCLACNRLGHVRKDCPDKNKNNKGPAKDKPQTGNSGNPQEGYSNAVKTGLGGSSEVTREDEPVFEENAPVYEDLTGREDTPGSVDVLTDKEVTLEDAEVSTDVEVSQPSDIEVQEGDPQSEAEQKMDETKDGTRKRRIASVEEDEGKGEKKKLWSEGGVKQETLGLPLGPPGGTIHACEESECDDISDIEPPGQSCVD